MTKRQFIAIRMILEKTQKEMAQLLGTSLKAIQSFEQGWRKVPSHAARHMLFLLASKYTPGRKIEPCWAIRACPRDIRSKCPAWEFGLGHLCWFVNGTLCRGLNRGSWSRKMKICSHCEAFQQAVRDIPVPGLARRNPLRRK